MSLGHDLLEHLAEEIELRRRRRIVLARDEPDVARGLAQPQQDLQRAEHVPRLDRFHVRVLAARAHRVVHRALGRSERAAKHHLRARRQLWCDVRLAPAQHERPDPRAQPLDGAALPARDGQGRALLEVAAPAEEPRVREVELAPELVEAVLDRASR